MKKGKRLLSVLMAFVMILSAFAATMAASAQEVYKPTYTKDVTEEDVSLMLGDVNTILARDVLNGAAIESIYKMLPSLKSIMMYSGAADASDQAAFYKSEKATALNQERFAELPDGKIIADEVDENGNVVVKGTFTAFFETHPIVCSNLEDVRNELNNIVDTVVVENLLNAFPFAFLMAGATEDAKKLCAGLDEICEALGVAQEAKSIDVLGLDMMAGGQPNVAGTRTYLSNIVNALLPDASNNLMKVVQRVAVDENNAKIYDGASQILGSLNGVLKGLSGTLMSLGVDISEIEATLTDIQNTFAALPTKDTEAGKALDIEGVISYLVGSLTSDALTIKFVNRAEGNGTAPKRFLAAQPKALVAIEFRHMKLDRVANAESTADVAKIIYDYLYDNLIANRKNNDLIKMAIDLGIIESALGIKLPADVKAFVLKALETDREPLADDLI
ncbi:MAG: hypothetical protein K1V97_00555, partial [Lachnospiraceae bacterium]